MSTPSKPLEGSTEWNRQQAEKPLRTEADNRKIREDERRIEEAKQEVLDRAARERAQMPSNAQPEAASTVSADPTGAKGGIGPLPRVPEQNEARDKAHQRAQKGMDSPKGQGRQGAG